MLIYSKEIQGNILLPFPKNHQSFLLLTILDESKVKLWLRELSGRITTTFDLAIKKHGAEDKNYNSDTDSINCQQCCIGVSFTIDGICHLLSENSTDLNTFTAFREGASIRSKKLGQDGENSSNNWVFGGSSNTKIDMILTVAAIKEKFVIDEVRHQKSAARTNGIKISYIQFGGDLSDDMTGKEHFGFTDGISQPLVKGIDDFYEKADDKEDQHLDNPLLNPGEFILGYPRGLYTEDIPPLPFLHWMKNGSFQVFIRFLQDVQGWRQQLTRLSYHLSKIEPISEQQLAAKFIGRWPSGKPLAVSPDNDNGNIKNYSVFDYEDDPFGYKTPRFSHIRKMYPRTTTTIDREWHRIIRRGVPFGPSFDPKLGSNHSAHFKRGLLMNAFMSSIERQFEFLMRAWANDPDFPEADDGQDPLIGKTSSLRLHKISGITQQFQFQQFVRTSGMIYSFAPSVSFIKDISE